MNNGILQKTHELLARGVPFALATVVRRERPTSGEPGDKAIVTADGGFVGWVGGSCAQPTVLKEAQKALADGEPRLVVLTPNVAEESREGVELYRMTCYSGGTMEIYIEPYLPAPQLLVCGTSPAAAALVKLGKAVGFEVFLIDPSATKDNFPEADCILAKVDTAKFAESRRRYAVVATMGNWDEEALKELVSLSPDYIGLVASRKRLEETLNRLSGDGVPKERLAVIRCPAGLDISARTFPEVALSILAEIVSLRRNEAAGDTGSDRAARAETPPLAEDPVCHMTVDPKTARHSLELDGTTYYFCNAYCRGAFEKRPQQYVASSRRT
jgi:xanthine dehydrogenase accessory factor